jgi:AcrR family transcriptional regulator
MTERRRRQSTPTRERLVDGAAEILAREGIAAATTKEIARAAGVSEPTLYAYFASKEQLLEEVLHERLLLPALVAELPDRPHERPVAAVLHDLVSSVLAAHRRLTPLLGAVLADPKLLATVRSDPPQDGRLGGLTRVREFFAAEQRSGRIGDAVPPQMLARLLFGASFHHAVMTSLFGESTMSPSGDRFVDALVDVLVVAAGPAAKPDPRV